MFDNSWLTFDSRDEFLNEILSVMFEEKVNSVSELKSLPTNIQEENLIENSEKCFETQLKHSAVSIHNVLD